MTTSRSRRDFLRLGTGTLVSSAMLSSFPVWQRALAQTSFTDYKALVCLYMIGGNDGFNWFIPLGNGYSMYSTARKVLTLPQNTVLPLVGPGSTPAVASDGYQYGIHPSCPNLKSYFDAGTMAVLANVGVLIQPTTQSAIRGGAPLPPQLFSHIDQQTLWYTSRPDTQETTGWAGRIGDTFKTASPTLGVNIDIGIPNALQQGADTNAYVLGTDGAPILQETTQSWRGTSRADTAKQLYALAANDQSLLVRQYAQIADNANKKVGIVRTAVTNAPDLATKFTKIDGDSDLGAQLHEVARVIKAASTIGDARHIFFVSLNGFDTHNNQLADQGRLLSILDTHVKSFWDAITEIGAQNKVTLFTASEFGRSTGTNGDGADHAWGNHHMILGGAVKGGQYYGTMPNMKIGGPDDFSPSGVGQIIPTTSTDQYGGALATWFGVPSAALSTVFPRLSVFPTGLPAFMKA